MRISENSMSSLSIKKETTENFDEICQKVSHQAIGFGVLTRIDSALLSGLIPESV